MVWNFLSEMSIWQFLMVLVAEYLFFRKVRKITGLERLMRTPNNLARKQEAVKAMQGFYEKNGYTPGFFGYLHDNRFNFLGMSLGALFWVFLSWWVLLAVTVMNGIAVVTVQWFLAKKYNPVELKEISAALAYVKYVKDHGCEPPEGHPAHFG